MRGARAPFAVEAYAGTVEFFRHPCRIIFEGLAKSPPDGILTPPVALPPEGTWPTLCGRDLACGRALAHEAPSPSPPWKRPRHAAGAGRHGARALRAAGCGAEVRAVAVRRRPKGPIKTWTCSVQSLDLFCRFNKGPRSVWSYYGQFCAS